MFAMTGLAHFIGMREELIRMVPPSLPQPELLVSISGVLELLGVVGLVLRRTAALSAACLTLLMLTLYPANVYAAQHHLTDATSDQLPYRTAMELVFLTAAILVATRHRTPSHARPPLVQRR